MHTITINIRENVYSMANVLRLRLSAGAVTFVYKKESTGELRIAHGTLCPLLFTYERKGGREPPHDQISYWDLDKGQWRSVKTRNIIRILD